MYNFYHRETYPSRISETALRMEDGLEVQPLNRVSLDTASWAVTRGEGTGKAQYRSSVIQASVQCIPQ